MKYLRNEKGQGLVAYAVVLAFALIAGLIGRNTGLLEGASALFVPTEKVLAEIDHHRTYDVAPAAELLSSEALFKNYTEGANNANNINWQRGMVRSGWVEAEGHEDDAQIKLIKDLADEVGATQWSFLTGAGDNYWKQMYWAYNEKNDKWEWKNYNHNKKGQYDLEYAVNNLDDDAGMYIGDKGLYWTVQELEKFTLTAHSTKEKYNYSEELVLQYFYSAYTNKYYVIKSHVWLNQGDVANHIALAGFHQQYFKPAGYFVAKRDENGEIIAGGTEGFSTLADAKELFEEVRRNNMDANGQYSVVFTEATTDPATDPGTTSTLFDIPAGDYVIVNNAYALANKYEPHSKNN